MRVGGSAGPPAERTGEEQAMPLPRWLARINKRFMNPREIRRGVRPVLTHVGRSSGRPYRTPLDAHAVPDGYVFIPMYGPRTDWLRNVLAAGSARLSIGGGDVPLTSPRMVRRKDVWSSLPAGTRTPPGVSDETELLRMDVVREG
jgi:deazaflavin-dependent oxidoreductase (nitroreductase family)